MLRRIKRGQRTFRRTTKNSPSYGIPSASTNRICCHLSASARQGRQQQQQWRRPILKRPPVSSPPPAATALNRPAPAAIKCGNDFRFFKLQIANAVSIIQLYKKHRCNSSFVVVVIVIYPHPLDSDGNNNSNNNNNSGDDNSNGNGGINIILIPPSS